MKSFIHGALKGRPVDKFQQQTIMAILDLDKRSRCLRTIVPTGLLPSRTFCLPVTHPSTQSACGGHCNDLRLDWCPFWNLLFTPLNATLPFPLEGGQKPLHFTLSFHRFLASV
jgi:hypothetical protein